MRQAEAWMRVGLGCLVACCPALVRGENAPWSLPRLEGRVVIDGRPDDRAWASVAPLPLTRYAPTYGGAPEQRSEIRVAYDDEALYAVGRFDDSDPGAIRVNSLYRDRTNGDDTFTICVDPFNDNANAKCFGTTPASVRFDFLLSTDGTVRNESWDAYWDATAMLTPEGWSVEVRIPFSTLGFQAVDGRAVMGLSLSRLVSRSGERITFPDIDARFDFEAPSQAQPVVLESVRSRRPLHLTPYALGGIARRVEPLPGVGGWEASSDFTHDVGADLNYAVTPTLTLDLTARTDFAQVEADEQQVALDRFPLFFPEKRRFFQEGSGLFDFATTGGGQLFHSRRIGLTDDRRPVPVLGGARLVGRVGAWELGLLDMQTDALDSTPSENFGVLRLRHGVLNPHSFLGVLATTRLGGGRHNAAVGADGLFRLLGNHYLTLKWAASFDDSDTAATDGLGRSLVHAKWQRRTERGLSYTLEAQRVGSGYRPEMGFLPRSDVTTANAAGNWYFFTDKHSYLRRVYPGALAFQTFRNSDGALETGTWAAWVQWDTKAGGGGWIEPKLFRENVREAFAIGSTTIPAGRYTFADLQVVFSMPQGARRRTDVNVRAGSFFDGTRFQAVVTPTWNVSRHLELGASYQLTRLRFHDRREADDIHLAGLQVRAALHARASANAFVQFNSTTQRVDANIRLRYNFAEGTDLWVVYDEGLLTDRLLEPGSVPLPLSASRTLLVKCTYTFNR
jgi:Domain of unknown function (DUF5916)/Carbohydrate family 9 binding domain-like